MEELLKVRYKVIADYPNTKLQSGDILKEEIFEENVWFAKERYGEAIHSEEIGKYPHLFKKLEWYEERKLNEMPDYVEVQGNMIDAYGRVLKIDSWRIEEKIPIAVFEGHIMAAWYLTPSTEKKFNSQNK